MRFSLFRVSVANDERLSLYNHSVSDDYKNALIHDAIQSKAQITYRNSTYAFSNLESVGPPGAMIGRLARPKEIDVSWRAPDTGDLIDDRVPSNAWTWFAYSGVSTQVIAVMHRAEFFTGTPKGIGTILESLLNAGRTDHRFSFLVRPLSNRTGFWDVVDRASKVTSVTFELIPPNWFGGSDVLKRQLRDEERATNMRKKIISYQNSESGLHIDSSDRELRDEVDFISRGGGRWRAGYQDNNGKSQVAASDAETLTTETQGDGSRAAMNSAFDKLMDDILRRTGDGN